MSCGAVWRGVLARLIVVIHLVGRGFPCLPISSCRSPPSRGAGRRALLGGVSWRVVGGDLFVVWYWRVLAVSSCHRLVWRGVRPPSRHCVSSLRLVGRGGFGFSFCLGGSGWAAVLVSSVSWPVLACLRYRRGGAMPCSSSAHRRSRLAPCHHMATGHLSGRASPFGSSPASCSRVLSALVSYRLSRLEAAGREAGRRMLGYRGVVHHVSSINVYNEYDVCDVYKRYKNTRIRGYDEYMG